MSKYDTWTKVDLRNACKAAGIKYGNMTNETMRAALVAHYAVPAETLTPEDKAADAFTAAEKAASVEAPAETVVTTPAAEDVSEQRSDDAPTAPVEAAAPAAAEKPAKPKRAAKPAAALDQRNGVTRPAAGNKCAQVWTACEALKAQDTKLTFDALRPLVPAHIADATVRTQWSRYRKYNA